MSGILASISRAWPRIASGAAILAVAVVAGMISYTHIYELTLALHQSVLAARLMPVAIDGLITMGSIVLLQGGRLGWLGIGPGVMLSVFANVESGIRYGWLAAVWAAIPAVSFALASFILERWLSSQAKASIPAHDATAEAVSAAEDVPGDAPDDVPENVRRDVPASTVPTPPATVLQTVPATRAPRRPTAGKPKSPERVFAAEVERGELPSLRAIKTRLHVGTDKARAIRDDLARLLEQREAA